MKQPNLRASSWAELAEAAPDLATFASGRLRQGPAYLATVRADGAPRVHPVTPIIGGGTLFVFMEPTSPKGRDLERRSRYALHTSVPDNAGTGGEASLSGPARRVDDPERRAVATAAASYTPAADYILFELEVDEVVVTEYDASGRPKRRRWRTDARTS
ncbi:MAG: pyridoxamine 5'-phosphate oxidase family protein [Acidimicrobiales bacterium]